MMVSKDEEGVGRGWGNEYVNMLVVEGVLVVVVVMMVVGIFNGDD